MIMDYLAGLGFGICIGFSICCILVYFFIRENKIRFKLESDK